MINSDGKFSYMPIACHNLEISGYFYVGMLSTDGASIIIRRGYMNENPSSVWLMDVSNWEPVATVIDEGSYIFTGVSVDGGKYQVFCSVPCKEFTSNIPDNNSFARNACVICKTKFDNVMRIRFADIDNQEKCILRLVITIEDNGKELVVDEFIVQKDNELECVINGYPTEPEYIDL